MQLLLMFQWARTVSYIYVQKQILKQCSSHGTKHASLTGKRVLPSMQHSLHFGNLDCSCKLQQSWQTSRLSGIVYWLRIIWTTCKCLVHSNHGNYLSLYQATDMYLQRLLSMQSEAVQHKSLSSWLETYSHCCKAVTSWAIVESWFEGWVKLGMTGTLYLGGIYSKRACTSRQVWF